jgi:predicted RNA-binding Zn-ribbon protein involved in translation (DUF1610 family)
MSEPDSKEKKDSPWVIVNCPSCEKKIKLPKDKVGAVKFKCPLCSEKISVSLPAAAAEKAVQSVEAAVSPASSRVDEPIDLMGQASPEIDEEDEKEGFLARIRGADDEPRHLDEGEVMEKDGQQVVKRRRRVRKKKKADTGPNWESDSKDEDRPNRDEDYSYVVDTEIDDEGNVVEVRRRVKADQKATTYEKFSTNMGKVFVAFSVLVVLGLVGAVAFIMKTGGKGEGPTIGDKEEHDTGEITTDITSEAFAVIQKYLTSNTWTEQVGMVRNPNEVRSLMEAHYEKHEFERREGATVIEVNGEKAARREKVVRREQQDVLDAVFVAVAFPLGDYKYFALEKKRIPGTNDTFEYLIDWEVTERYREVPAQTFKDLHEPGSEAEFRVSLQGPGTYFQPPFNADEWRCYSITYPGDPDFQFFGYTKRGTDVDQKTLELFVSSGRPTPIIKVAYPKANVVDSTCVEITELILSTWFK